VVQLQGEGEIGDREAGLGHAGGRATQGAVAEGFCRSDGGNGLKIELKFRKCEVKEARFSNGSPE